MIVQDPYNVALLVFVALVFTCAGVWIGQVRSERYWKPRFLELQKQIEARKQVKGKRKNGNNQAGGDMK